MTKDISAASIETPEFSELLYRFGVAFKIGSHDQLVNAGNALVQHIDSRPRSEDRRAKVLESVRALAPDVADVLTGREKIMFENGFYKCRGEALAALASTTPQKADDE